MRLSRSIPVLAWLLAAVPCGALALPAQVEHRKPIVIDNPREPVPPPGRRWMVSFHEELTVGVAEGVYVGRFTTELDLSSIVFRGKKAYLAAEEDGYSRLSH